MTVPLLPRFLGAAFLLLGICSCLECDPEMRGKCICGEVVYERKLQFLVNCTDSGFNNTTPLQHLPPETEVAYPYTQLYR